MDMLDWKLLVALDKEKSMAKAGASLFLSQPAVVYRLDRLEKEFKTTLFLRSAKGIRFTEAGTMLLSHANDMIERDSNIHQEVQQKGEGLSGSITIGSSSTFLENFLPKQLKAFSAQYKDIFVSLLNRRNGPMVDMISNEQLMVAIVRGDYKWKINRFYIYDDPMILVSYKPINVSELQDMNYIPYSKDTGIMSMIADWSARNFEKTIKTNYDITQAYGIRICLELVKAGLGWSIVPLTRVSSLLKEFYYLPVTYSNGTPMSRPTQLIFTDYAKEHRLYSAYINHFIEFFSHYSFPTL